MFTPGPNFWTIFCTCCFFGALPGFDCFRNRPRSTSLGLKRALKFSLRSLCGAIKYPHRETFDSISFVCSHFSSQHVRDIYLASKLRKSILAPFGPKGRLQLFARNPRGKNPQFTLLFAPSSFCNTLNFAILLCENFAIPKKPNFTLEDLPLEPTFWRGRHKKIETLNVNPKIKVQCPL